MLAIVAFASVTPAIASAYSPPPVDAGFDYQIGGDYPLSGGGFGGLSRLVQR